MQSVVAAVTTLFGQCRA